jgi:aryl-alcohol dehydrogenase-like predicted oxidoreductase
MQRISKEINTAIPALSLELAMAKDGISCTLVGSQDVNEMKMNIDTASGQLPKDIIEELDRLSDPVFKKIGSSTDYYESRENSLIY